MTGWTLAEARQALRLAVRETLADNPGLPEDEVAAALVDVVAHEVEDPAALAEFYRTELGWLSSEGAARLAVLRSRQERAPGGLSPSRR